MPYSASDDFTASGSQPAAMALPEARAAIVDALGEAAERVERARTVRDLRLRVHRDHLVDPIGGLPAVPVEQLPDDDRPEGLPLPPPGHGLWRVVGDTSGHVVSIPNLDPVGLAALALADPRAVVRLTYRVMARATAALTGQCSLCGAVVDLPTYAGGISPDPQRYAASWTHAPLTMGITHAPTCPALLLESDRDAFDPRALAPPPDKELDQ